MSKQEKIVCAGAKVKFIKHFRGKPNNENITKEVIFPMISRNHEDHIVQVDTMLELSGRADSDRFSKMSTQYGFITNKNRFVDAKEAMQIAIKEGQIKELAELDLIIREFEEYEEESGIETNQLMSARESYGEFYHQFSCRELKPEDLY